MNTRLLKFLESENISQSQFADNIGVARASISHIISGRNKPGYDFIERTASRYPSLNIEWLITGRGKMYLSDAEADRIPRCESPARRIERIMVFYSDGTFEELNAGAIQK